MGQADQQEAELWASAYALHGRMAHNQVQAERNQHQLLAASEASREERQISCEVGVSAGVFQQQTDNNAGAASISKEAMLDKFKSDTEGHTAAVVHSKEYAKNLASLWEEHNRVATHLPMSWRAMEEHWNSLPDHKTRRKERRQALELGEHDNESTICWKAYATGWRKGRAGINYMTKRGAMFRYVQKVIIEEREGNERQGILQVQELINDKGERSISKFIDHLEGNGPKRKRRNEDGQMAPDEE